MEYADAEVVMGTGTMVNETSHRAFFDGFVMCSSRGWQCSHLSSAVATSTRILYYTFSVVYVTA